MLRVTFTSKDCPKMFMFLYFWFTKEYLLQIYTISLTNIRHLEFGQFFSCLVKLFLLVFRTHRGITYQYNTSYKQAYQKYCSI